MLQLVYKEDTVVSCPQNAYVTAAEIDTEDSFAAVNAERWTMLHLSSEQKLH